MPNRLLAQSGVSLPLVRTRDLQPLVAQVKRLLEATKYLGIPLKVEDTE